MRAIAFVRRRVAWPRPRMLVTVAVVLLAAARIAQAQAVRGRVIDPANEPLNLVEVQLLPLGRHVVTASAGTFNFENVPQGSYTLQVRRLGFREVTRSITVPVPTGMLTVTMQPVPVELDTVYTLALQKELPYVFQRMKEHLGAVAFGPDLIKRFPGASLDEVLEMDPKPVVAAHGRTEPRRRPTDSQMRGAGVYRRRAGTNAIGLGPERQWHRSRARIAREDE